jgi:uncharacterized PurR-regulated membrane protein YhhQ (DUF165 family)
MTKTRIGLVALVAYVATVWLANYFVTHVGHQAFPGGPHLIPVGFGLEGPSGVLWVGAALVLRDVVQRHLGKLAVVGAILVGTGLAYFIAPALAVASAAAFLASEALDFAIFTPLAERGRLVAAVAVSNVAGAVVDTFLFLWLAFGSIAFWQGQIVGKLWMTLPALLVLAYLSRQREAAMAG